MITDYTNPTVQNMETTAFLRYKIYLIKGDSVNSDPNNMFGNPVYHVEAKKLVELGFHGARNDFSSEKEAQNFISKNEDLKGWLLTILPYATGC